MANEVVHDLKGKTVALTGALGLIGRPLHKLLIDEGAIVLPIDLRSGDCFRVDLNDYAETLDFFTNHKVDHVFHLAGKKGGASTGRTQGLDFLTANVRCTMNLVEALVECGFKGRLLFTSSVGAYPGNLVIFEESQALDGEPHASDYYGGHGKRVGELLCRAAHEQHGLDFVTVRPTNCFGPWDTSRIETAMVITALIRRLEAGENPLVLTGNPETRRDFLYSECAAAGMIEAMRRGRITEIYNLGVGAHVSIRMVAEVLADMYQRKLVIKETHDAAPSFRLMDMEKTKSELGFRATFSVEQLRETVEWARANK